MYNLGDDNELDRVSREAAGRFVPPAEANWQALSDELDKVMPTEKKRRRFIFWWFLPALVAGGAATYLLVPKKVTPVAANATKTTITQTDKKDTKDNKTAVPNTATVDAKKENTALTSNIEKQTITTNSKPADKKEPVSTQEKTNAPAGNGSLVIDNKRSASNSTEEVAAQQAKKDQVISMPAPKAETNVTKEKEQGKTEETINKKEEASKDVVSTPAKDNATDAKQDPVQQVTDQPGHPATTPQATPKRGKGWSFALLAGVDKSTVKFKYSENAGINIGLIAGYHLSDRWSIHTGAIYTQKNYKVAGEDFTAPKGSWASYYNLETVEGYCRMWEVPLMTRYTVSQSVKSSFFLGAGLSSYFMTREDYDYTYYTATGSLAVRNTAYSSTDTHVLSILHLSTGFEKFIGNKWSMLIEPYAKIPLGGVGQGNIRLSSFGLNFSLQHRQPSKN